MLICFSQDIPSEAGHGCTCLQSLPERLRLEDHKLKASLGYTTWLWLKKKKKSYPHDNWVQCSGLWESQQSPLTMTCELNGNAMGTHMTPVSLDLPFHKNQTLFLFTIAARLGRGGFRGFPKVMSRTLPVSISTQRTWGQENAYWASPGSREPTAKQNFIY